MTAMDSNDDRHVMTIAIHLSSVAMHTVSRHRYRPGHVPLPIGGDNNAGPQANVLGRRKRRFQLQELLRLMCPSHRSTANAETQIACERKHTSRWPLTPSHRSAPFSRKHAANRGCRLPNGGARLLQPRSIPCSQCCKHHNPHEPTDEDSFPQRRIENDLSLPGVLFRDPHALCSRRRVHPQ